MNLRGLTDLASQSSRARRWDCQFLPAKGKPIVLTLKRFPEKKNIALGHSDGPCG